MADRVGQKGKGNGGLPDDWALAEVPLQDFLDGLREMDGAREEDLSHLSDDEIEARLRGRKGIKSLLRAGLDFAVRRTRDALGQPVVMIVVGAAVAVALYRLQRRRRRPSS
jgi:hypothetical protein